MPLSEFIWEARRLAELCNYPNDKDKLIRDTIVSGIRSLRAYQKCLDTKDLGLQDCIAICQAEDAICMQVQDCRPESINTIQSTRTMISVNRLQQNPRQSHLPRIATAVGHQTGPESIPGYSRLKTIFAAIAIRGAT